MFSFSYVPLKTNFSVYMLLFPLKSHFFSTLIAYFLQPISCQIHSPGGFLVITQQFQCYRGSSIESNGLSYLKQPARISLSSVISLQISGQERKILEMKPRRPSYHLSAEDLEKNSFINIRLVLFLATQFEVHWQYGNFLYNSDIMFKLPIGTETCTGQTK